MPTIQKFYHYVPLMDKTGKLMDKTGKLRFDWLQASLGQKIYLSPVAEFNDQKEGYFYFVVNPDDVLNIPELFYYNLDYFKKNGEPGLTEEDLRSRLKSDEFRTAVQNEQQKSIQPFFKGYGVFCLTEDCNSIRMWNEYAGNQLGYCLVFELNLSDIYETFFKNRGWSQSEFDAYTKAVFHNGSEIFSFVPNDNSNISIVLAKVSYKSDFSRLDVKKISAVSSRYEINKYVVQNSIGVKRKEFEHEREHRLIVNLNSHDGELMDLRGYFPYLKVTGLILGPCMAESEKNEIYKLCMGLKEKILLYEARQTESDVMTSLL